MLLAALGVTTDKKSENILSVNCSFQEVLIAPVTVVAVPRSQLKNPGSNDATKTVGNKSILKTGADTLKGIGK